MSDGKKKSQRTVFASDSSNDESTEKRSDKKHKRARSRSRSRERESSSHAKDRHDNRDRHHRHRDREDRRRDDKPPSSKHRDADRRGGGGDDRGSKSSSSNAETAGPSERRRPEREEGSTTEGSKPAWETSQVKEHLQMIQGRHSLWGGGAKKSDSDKQSEQSPAANASNAEKNAAKWTSMITATVGDGQQADKFRRLMGIKKPVDTADDNKKLEQEAKRQRDQIQGLERQFENARASHFGGRGMGFGFGSG